MGVFFAAKTAIARPFLLYFKTKVYGFSPGGAYSIDSQGTKSNRNTTTK